MNRKISTFFILAFLNCQLMAAEVINDDPIVTIKREYENHPAASNPSSMSILYDLLEEIVIHIGSFLDKRSVCAYVCSCKPINSQQYPLYAMLLPELYQLQNLDLRRAFFPLEHHQWKPDSLLPEQRWTIHYRWFLRGHKIPEPSGDTLSEAENGLVREKMRLLYSSACCGHQLAAEEVGQLLLNPRFNNVIPTVVTYDDLEPGVIDLDVRRLHQARTENKQLAEILKELYQIGEEQDSAKAKVDKLVVYKNSLDKLSTLEQTDEVTFIKLALKALIEHLKTFSNEEGFVPTEAINYAKAHRVNTPLVDGFLIVLKEKENPSHVMVDHYREYYLSLLNNGFINLYADSMAPQWYTDTPDEQDSSRTVTTFIKTEQARNVLQKVLQLKRTAILLGEQREFYLPTILTLYDISALSISPDPSEHYVYQTLIYLTKPQEDRINLFLLYLALTRNPTARQFQEVKLLMQNIMSHPALQDAQRSNAVRYSRLTEHFSISDAIGPQTPQV